MGAPLVRASHRDRPRGVPEGDPHPVRVMATIVLWMSTVVIGLVFTIGYLL